MRKTIAKREWEKGGEREGRSRKRRGKEREREELISGDVM